MSINVSDYKKEYDLISLAGVETVDYSETMYQTIIDWVNANLSDYFTATIYSGYANSKYYYGMYLQLKGVDAGGLLYGWTTGGNYKFCGCYYKTGGLITNGINKFTAISMNIDNVKLVIIGNTEHFASGWYVKNADYYIVCGCEMLNSKQLNIIGNATETVVQIANEYGSAKFTRLGRNNADAVVLSNIVIDGEISSYLYSCDGNYISSGTLYEIGNNVYTNLYSDTTKQFYAVKVN